MTAVYAAAVTIGLVLIVTWAAFGVVSSAVEGWGGLDPEKRFGRPGRAGIAALTGFGMGGMSATFAGWNLGLALLAATIGAGVMLLVAAGLGPGPDTSNEPNGQDAEQD